jgi:hypothetical protein
MNFWGTSAPSRPSHLDGARPTRPSVGSCLRTRDPRHGRTKYERRPARRQVVRNERSGRFPGSSQRIDPQPKYRFQAGPQKRCPSPNQAKKRSVEMTDGTGPAPPEGGTGPVRVTALLRGLAQLVLLSWWSCRPWWSSGRSPRGHRCWCSWRTCRRARSPSSRRGRSCRPTRPAECSPGGRRDPRRSRSG